MKTTIEMINAREEYIGLIRSELLGPGSEISIPDAEHELITNAPQVRYSMGILYPQENKINSENDDSMRIEESNVEEVDEEIDKIKENNEKSINEMHISDFNDEEKDFDEEKNLDEEISLASQNLPSSVGMTFFISEDCARIKCDISFATYRRAIVEDCLFPYNPENNENFNVPDQLIRFLKIEANNSCIRLRTAVQKKEIRQIFETDSIPENQSVFKDIAYKLCDQLRMGYVRVPHEVEIELDFSKGIYIDNNKELDGTTAKITALKRKITDDIYSITVMMVNDLEDKAKGINCIHQPVICVDTNKNAFKFCEYSDFGSIGSDDEEEQSLALLYRNKKMYGTGLGTALEWEIDYNGMGKLYNEFFPQIEVPSIDFKLPQKTQVPKDVLSMRGLSDLNTCNRNEKIQWLTSLVDTYDEWVEGLNKKLSSLEIKYQNQANRNIDNCLTALKRMRSGIEMLEKNDDAWSAFLLANRAMFIQREQLEFQEKTSKIDRYPGNSEIEELLVNIDYKKSEDKHFWRPFQLCFILMNIVSMVEERSPERDLVDLIWFPTGGGKTEAYLGLTAFVIFFRRIVHKIDSSGTAVIMRYTLRLLASQQFTRAATLICACEYIRMDCDRRRSMYTKYDLGKESITIGLWIGSAHTPNKNKDALKCLDKLNGATVSDIKYVKDRYNKFQVLKCPWCGTKLVKGIDNNKIIGQWGYKMRNNKSFYMSCPNVRCDFNNKLPIQIVDEEIYKNPPSLLFGTVDKFAMLPWKKEVGNIFAAHNKNRTPELIIQDELHLISGPLGTMVGLYESSIDALCSIKGIRPKIVASTATIRRAKEQCSVLYNREVSQFPPSGIDSGDSFFARESIVSYDKLSFGRKYIGLMPSGKTKAMMEVRSLAALFQKIHSMNLDEEIKDKYWTLTVYFNSLKDLGKCSTLIDDDVKDFIKRMVYRLGTARDARIIVGADELTSRVSTTELNETLDKLEKWNYSKENIEKRRYASNALIATNMISVGIDIARLNVMLMVGQPKLTSEYIQASSRIGRSFPGVAFTLYDGTKSRDRSHYEQFKPYHESFYRFVEPTGATPFSKPARDRALHAVVISIIRNICEKLTDDNEAGNFNKEDYIEQTEKIKKYILDRTRQIANRNSLDMIDDSKKIESEIDMFFDKWERLASANSEMFYGQKFMIKQPGEGEVRLLKQYNTSKDDSSAIDTMTSMRNVDSMVAGNVLVWED
jgi:hypothetical protein